MTVVEFDPGDHEVGMGVKTLDLIPGVGGPADAYFDFFLIEDLFWD